MPAHIIIEEKRNHPLSAFSSWRNFARELCRPRPPSPANIAASEGRRCRSQCRRAVAPKNERIVLCTPPFLQGSAPALGSLRYITSLFMIFCTPMISASMPKRFITDRTTGSGDEVTTKTSILARPKRCIRATTPVLSAMPFETVRPREFLALSRPLLLERRLDKVINFFEQKPLQGLCAKPLRARDVTDSASSIP